MWCVLSIGLAIMSSHATLEHNTPTWTLLIEHNSGAYDDEAREARALSRWKASTQPWFQLATIEIKNTMEALHKQGSATWRELPIRDEEKRAALPRIYEVEVDKNSAETHVKKGNHACVFVMRFHPAQVSGTLFVELLLQQLPPESDRQALAKAINERLARIPRDEDL